MTDEQRKEKRLEIWDRLRTAPSMWLTGYGSIYQMSLTPEERQVVMEALSPFAAKEGQ